MAIRPGKITKYPFGDTVLEWTQQAVECHDIQSNCSICPIPKMKLDTLPARTSDGSYCHVASTLPHIADKSGELTHEIRDKCLRMSCANIERPKLTDERQKKAMRELSGKYFDSNGNPVKRQASRKWGVKRK